MKPKWEMTNPTLARFDEDLPEPLDHWSLDDFGDLVGPAVYTS